ncbi:MAG: hydrogenase maturation nickel metallochaperone HypA [Natronomonas sp.]
MHELSVAQRLVDAALDAAADHGADRIDTITVELGTATHVAADQLEFCLDALTDGTPAATATIEFDRIDPRGRCSCGWSGSPSSIDGVTPETPSLRCPDCGSRLSLTAGRECRVARIEVPDRPDVSDRADTVGTPKRS